MLFSAYAELWQDNVLSMKKPATIATCRSHIRMLNSAFGALPLGEIGHQQVQAFISAQSKTKVPVTVCNIWLTLHSLLSGAQREGLIPAVPKPVLPRKMKVAQEWLTGEQMRGVVAASEGLYKVFYAVMAETGMRIGEVVAMRESDVCLDNMTITVRKSIWNGREQAPKTDNSTDRVIAISGWLADLLRPYVEGTTGTQYIFRTTRGTPWWPAPVLKHLHRTLTELGISPVGFHAFRRGNITLCVKLLGIPEAIVAQRVGHACEGMTLGVYNQRVDGVDRVWVEKIAEALR